MADLEALVPFAEAVLELRNYTVQLEQVKADIDHAELLLSDTNDKVADADARAEKASKNLESIRAEIRTYQESLEAIKVQQAQALVDMRNTVESERAKASGIAQAELDELKTNISRLKDEAGSALAARNEAVASLNAAKAEYESWRARFAPAM